MGKVSLINRDPNFRADICQRVHGKGVICDGISKNDVIRLSTPFDEIKKDGKSISGTDDLLVASKKMKERELAKKRVLIREQNGGYILIGSLTCIGTLAIGTLIFMVIKFFIMG